MHLLQFVRGVVGVAGRDSRLQALSVGGGKGTSYQIRLAITLADANNITCGVLLCVGGTCVVIWVGGGVCVVVWFGGGTSVVV